MNKIKNSIKTISMTAAVVGFLGLGAGSAEAASFNFSYTLQGGSILSGTLDGDLQGDMDTVFVNSITSSFFDGDPRPPLPFVDSVFDVVGGFGAGLPAKVSFSGSIMDLYACTDAFSVCSDEVVFFDGIGVGGSPFYQGGPSFGNTSPNEAFISSNWRLTAQTPQSVPEPSSLLGLLGAGAFVAILKRKNK